MDGLYGYMLYGISLATMGGIYAVLTLGLNVQWGFAGLFNAGIAGFFGIGAYTGAILPTSATHRHIGGYEMPYAVGFLAAMLLCGIIAYLVGKVCLRLRSDYLAIATFGVAVTFENVMRNAIHHSPPHSTVRVTATRENSQAVVCIHDTGSGVADDQLDRLFEPFYRSPDALASGRSGTGLGLAIAMRAVETIAGSMKAANTEHGFVIEIRLPLAVS